MVEIKKRGLLGMFFSWRKRVEIYVSNIWNQTNRFDRFTKMVSDTIIHEEIHRLLCKHDYPIKGEEWAIKKMGY